MSRVEYSQSIGPTLRRDSVIALMKTVPPEMEQEWRQSFSMFDRDGDGCITFDEMAKVMRTLGNNPTDDELKQMMNELDEDQNGTIDLDEFLKIMHKHWKDPIDEEKELLEAFQVFDRNRDGYVEASEIKYVLTNLGHEITDEEVTKIITENDADCDGKLDYREFVKVMQNR